MNEFISVIVPVYKNIYFLQDALKSLRYQTYQNFEVIVINDGSKNVNKLKNIINFFKNHLNIKLITYKNNMGVSFALNKGIKASNGKYISWLSHDDYFHPTKLELQVKSISKNKNKIVFTGFYLVNDIKKIIGRKLYRNFRFKEKYHILIRDDLNLSTALIPKFFFLDIGYFDLTKKHTQDYDFMYRIFQKYEMVVINKPLFFSRMHKLQTSKVLKNEAIFEKKIFLISKINEIRKIYKKSNLLLKIYIIFFLRLKNIKKISFEIKKLINNENIFFTLILKIIFLMSELYISTKKKRF